MLCRYGAVVQGFFVKLENIGWWWRWMHWAGLDTTFHHSISQSKHQWMTAMLWRHDIIMPDLSGLYRRIASTDCFSLWQSATAV